MGTGAKHGLYITGKIRSTNCCFLIDSGSTDTIISASTYHKIERERRPILKTVNVNIQQVDGTPLPVLGAALVEIQIGKAVHLVNAIFADIKCEGILGMDFLLPTGGNLDFKSMVLNLNGDRLNCTNAYGISFVGRVVATKNVTVPPGHEAIICGRITNRQQEEMPGSAIVEPMDGGGELASTGLVLGRTLVNAKENIISVRVLNPGHKELTVTEGTTVGLILAAQVEENEVNTNSEPRKDLPEHLHDLFDLTYPTETGNFVPDTDASSEVIGAVLSQIQDGEERVLAYYSRKLSQPERNYCVTRQELLVVISSLKHFRQYLYGREVKIRTDHASLRWLINFKNPEGQMARWLEQLSEYQITIEHRSGRKHANADGLSRMQCKQCGRKEGEMDTGILTHYLVTPEKDDVDGFVRGIASQPSLSLDSLREAQLSDEDFRWMMSGKENDDPRPEWSSVAMKSSAVKTYWAQWDQIETHEGVLFRRWETDDGRIVRRQILLPEKIRKEAVMEMHGNPLGGHLGVRKTLAKVKAMFYWCGMTADIRSFIRTCSLCQRRKSPPKKRRAPLQQSRVGAPMERVAIDLMGPLPKTDSDNQWILVVGDYHTKWMEAYALPDAKAVTVARKLVEEFISRFGVRMELHSDQGSNRFRIPSILRSL